MEDFKQIGDDIAKNLKKLMKLNEKALESKDLNKIINIQNKYADYNNK